MKISDLTREEILEMDLRIQGLCKFKDECEIWTGYAYSWSKIRICVHRDGRRHSFHARRIRWLAQRREALGDDFSVMMKCENPRCLKAEHMYLMHRSEVLQKNCTKYLANRNLAISAALRKRSALTIEDVRAIRNAEGRLKDIAQQFSLSIPAVSAIRRGKYWKDVGSAIGRMAA